MGNRLCRGSVKLDSHKSLFSEFEIVTVREYNDYNGGTFLDEINTAAEYLDSANAYDEPFYRVYGVYKNKIPKSRRVIADFFDIKDAIVFLYELTGEDVQIVSY
jgi:hypothetical protein